jgi:wobble nucleotide-excising tRNase
MDRAAIPTASARGGTVVVETIQLVRNVGQFDSVSAGKNLSFLKLALLYAENGRGKTTLAAILRSLATGDPVLIGERRRLSATQPPHVVLKMTGAGTPFVFQNGAWSASFPDLAIFDDVFVAENVCSGIEIGAEHRQNLYELILGAQGVSLNAELQMHVVKIDVHNRDLKAKGDAIPASTRGTMTVDAFCALKAQPDIAKAIQEAERALAAGKSAQAVKAQSTFEVISLPEFDTTALSALLGRDLADLDIAAVAHVQAHLTTLGAGAERWVGDGMPRIPAASAGQDHDVCPFCAQDLRGSPLIDHYRAYFSEGYSSLKTAIAEAIRGINATHGGDIPAAFERAVRVAGEGREFWKSFAEVVTIDIDTAAVARAWKVARDAVLSALQAKRAAPLDRASLSAEALDAIKKYDKLRAGVAAVSQGLQALNANLAIIKEKATTANVATLTADLAKLKAIEARHNPTVAPLCQAYLDEAAAKRATEGLRDNARGALDTYRQKVFPAYERAINDYLQKFNAGFRLRSVTSVNNRSGSSCSYNMLINNVSVGLAAAPGAPSFRNTLSAGDRNTLALAFFFASLDRDPVLAQKIVVIDDPMTSLDEHRALTTVQEMRRLEAKVRQLVVLSHSKPFLCALWEAADKTQRTAVKITRDGAGSTLEVWDVNQDCITEHDRRHALVSSFIKGQQGLDERQVAAALRLILESFLRVAYPDDFPPGRLLGPFLGVCDQRKSTPTEILSATDIAELRDVLEYANKFHHDTNPAWETEITNDQMLLQFAKRTLKFAQRG